MKFFEKEKVCFSHPVLADRDIELETSVTIAAARVTTSQLLNPMISMPENGSEPRTPSTFMNTVMSLSASEVN